MPHILSLRDRRTRSDKASASISLSDTPANGLTTTANIKSILFPRRAATMGNTPSSLDAPRKSDSQLSTASKQMPGAEPPEPVTEHPISDSPKSQSKALEGYDVEALLPKLELQQEERDLEAAIPPEGIVDESSEVVAQEAQEVNGVGPHVEQTSANVDAAEPDRPQEQEPAPSALSERIPSPSSHDHTPESAATPIAPQSLTAAMWAPGIFVLLNAKSGTALDLHGGNHKTLIGFPMHGNANQQVRSISLPPVPSPQGHLIDRLWRPCSGSSSPMAMATPSEARLTLPIRCT